MSPALCRLTFVLLSKTLVPLVVGLLWQNTHQHIDIVSRQTDLARGDAGGVSWEQIVVIKLCVTDHSSQNPNHLWFTCEVSDFLHFYAGKRGLVELCLSWLQHKRLQSRCQFNFNSVSYSLRSEVKSLILFEDRVGKFRSCSCFGNRTKRICS